MSNTSCHCDNATLCLTATDGRARPGAAGTAATAQAASPSYARHVPERTLLYTLVQAHCPDFIARLEAEERSLPKHVHEEFEEYLRCGVLDHGFLRVVCEQCHAERLVAFSCKKRRLCPSCGARRMIEPEPVGVPDPRPEQLRDRVVQTFPAQQSFEPDPILFGTERAQIRSASWLDIRSRGTDCNEGERTICLRPAAVSGQGRRRARIQEGKHHTVPRVLILASIIYLAAADCRHAGK